MAIFKRHSCHSNRWDHILRKPAFWLTNERSVANYRCFDSTITLYANALFYKHASSVHICDFLIWSLSGFFVMTYCLYFLFAGQRGCIMLFEKNNNQLITVLIGLYRKKFAFGIKNEQCGLGKFLRPRVNIFLYGPPSR